MVAGYPDTEVIQARPRVRYEKFDQRWSASDRERKQKLVKAGGSTMLGRGPSLRETGRDGIRIGPKLGSPIAHPTDSTWSKSTDSIMISHTRPSRLCRIPGTHGPLAARVATTERKVCNGCAHRVANIEGENPILAGIKDKNL